MYAIGYFHKRNYDRVHQQKVLDWREERKLVGLALLLPFSHLDRRFWSCIALGRLAVMACMYHERTRCFRDLA